MLKKSKTRSELAAYLLVITVSIILGVSIGRFLLLRAGSSPLAQLEGTKFQLADADWQKSKNTLVIAFRVGCRYCHDSAEFYRVLSEQCRLKNVRLIAVSPNPVSEGQQYLKELGVTVDEVRQSDLPRLGIMRTPTLVLIDNSGLVSKSWLGQLSPPNEQDVLARLAGNSGQRG
jgi:peroxiredoxin